MATRIDPVPTTSDPLPDPIEWPRLPGAQLHFVLVIAGAVLLGLASTLLIGWALQMWEVALLYGALILAAAVVGYVSALGSARRGGGSMDWALIRAVLDARTDALAITDRADRLVCANSAYGARCGGYPSPLELAGTNAETRAILEGVASQARRDGHAHAEIMHLIEGQRRRLRISCRPAEASKTHLLWTVRRAPADKLLDDTIAMLEGPLGAWISGAGIMAVLTNRQGMVLAANNAFRLAAWPVTAVEAVNLSDVIVLSNGKPQGLRQRDGDVRNVRIIELPLRVEPVGTAEAYLFLMLDEAPVELPVAAPPPDDVPALLAVLPLGLALADRDGRFMFMNDAFVKAAAIGEQGDALYPSDLVIDEDKSMVSDAVRRVGSGPARPRDLRVRLKNRPEDAVVLTVARAPELGAAAVVLSLKDNSEQIKLEKQIAQATKMQAVGQLAGGVAHDFNNILTAVIGYCDLMLLRHSPGDADFDDINQIRQNANRAANLVRQLLAFSRQQTLRLQVLQVSDVIGELSHLLKRLLGETVTLTVKHGRNLAPVRVDPGQLEQVVVNLAVNARDAMPKGGELTISTYGVSADEVKRLGHEMMPAADYVAISVKDTGTGIPLNVLPKIFEPFFTTKEVGKGTGLGLSTVYGIVKQTGGFIFADSVPGRGTTFTIYLPAHAEIATEQAPVSRPEGDVPDLWGKGTILLVEDEAMVRAVAERALSRKGYEVLTASNGEEALEVLETRPEGVDLLISDVVMPTMDGPTLVGHARERFPNLRIIFMSGYAEEQLRREISVPGVAFLPKPFSVQELAEKVRSALSRSPS